MIDNLALRRDALGDSLPAGELWGDLYSELEAVGLRPGDGGDRYTVIGGASISREGFARRLSRARRERSAPPAVTDDGASGGSGGEGSLAEVEDWLRAEKAYNEGRGIARSETAIIDRFLVAPQQMRIVYDELTATTPGWSDVLESAIWAAAHMSPETTVELRQAARRLAELNEEIEDAALDLAELLEERAALQEQHPLSAHEDLHVVDWVGKAADSSESKLRFLFNSWLRNPLRALMVRFDFKYWPSLPAIIRAVGDFAREGEIEITDPAARAAVDSPKWSRLDFVRGFLENCRYRAALAHQPELRLSDRALATLVNVALDLGPGEAVNPAQMGAFRRRST